MSTNEDSKVAKKAAQAAAAEMRKRNLEMTIAVVDSGSNLATLVASTPT